eukprot:TRINITY_DN183_c0_g1_i1.p1 TRINITY_DN183_c0_g1~~TRINITY_DN183_c0_g1_i1.p1  ORF type:complete len:599 (-),score=180.28 TRINITY_DN183_c0_g1_i1:874-2670(-)
MTSRTLLAAGLLLLGAQGFAPPPPLRQHGLRPIITALSVKTPIKPEQPTATTPTPVPPPNGGDFTPPQKDKDLFLKLELDYADFIAFSGRAVDTVEDALTHLRRSWEPKALGALNIKRDLSTQEGAKPRLVVLGTGWGGHALVKVIDHEKYDVVVVSPRNCFVFTPMLAASAVGTVDTSSITESIKEANPQVTYVQGTVRSVDADAHRITVDTFSSLNEGGSSASVEKFELEYSKLVYAVGSKTGTFGIKGVLEDCYVLKEVSDARRLRRALLRKFDEASFPGVDEARRRALLSFLVIGSGPTGIEFTGELSDLLRTDVPRLFPDLLPYISLKILSADKTILPMFDKVLQEKGLKTLAAAGANVMLDTVVKEIKPGAAILSDGSQVPFGLCFWAGGTEARKLTRDTIAKIPGQSEMEGAARGQLTVDAYMRVKGVEDGSILGIGDAVRVAGQRLPTTGQVAAQEGAYVARLLNRGYALEGGDSPPIAPSIATEDKDIGAVAADWLRLRGDLTARPFHFLNLGVLAYLGSGAGVAELRGGDKTRLLDASGTVGFFLWRSTYLVKQVSMRNRVCVAIDWFKAKAFGRDFTSPSDYYSVEE